MHCHLVATRLSGNLCSLGLGDKAQNFNDIITVWLVPQTPGPCASTYSQTIEHFRPPLIYRLATPDACLQCVS